MNHTKNQPRYGKRRINDSGAASAEAQIPDALIPEVQIPDAQIPDAQIPDAQIPDVANASEPDERGQEPVNVEVEAAQSIISTVALAEESQQPKSISVTAIAAQPKQKPSKTKDPNKQRLVWLAALFSLYEESMAEIKINKFRILLSLFGVMVSVAVLAAVFGFGTMAKQLTQEQMEIGSGRAATLGLHAYNYDGIQISQDKISAAVSQVVKRYDLSTVSIRSSGDLKVQFADGVKSVRGTIVNRGYGESRRIPLVAGSWFTAAHEKMLANPIIISEAMWLRLGSPDLATHPTLELVGNNAGTAIIVGVEKRLNDWMTDDTAFFLYDRYKVPAGTQTQPPEYQFWVKPELSEQLIPLIQKDVQGSLGSNAQVYVDRIDYSGPLEESMGMMTLVLGIVASSILGLGALSMLNIALVTIRQRIREIGIRRSFGATPKRIFFSVMLESVIGTLVAGVLGIILAVIVLRSEIVMQNFEMVTEPPPFPMEAALIALGATLIVGVITGLAPALYAVRAKVIDVIKY